MCRNRKNSCVPIAIFCLLLVVVKSGGRRQYPYPAFYHQHHANNTNVTSLLKEKIQDSSITNDISEVKVVDEKTGIQYNPYSKHHPGRHVCTNHLNVSYPMKTKQTFSRPTYKRYRVRCGSEWCAGVKLVYEKYHKDVVREGYAKQVAFSCCPGWAQAHGRNHGCHKPLCTKTCLNGGNCVGPDTCSCPEGFAGANCERRTRVDTGGICRPGCENGGSCDATEGVCRCAGGFEGARCELDLDECKLYKPCDHMCYNTPGSYKCECKETFALQKDGESCHKEDDENTAVEAKDLEHFEYEQLDKRLKKLEEAFGKNRTGDTEFNNIYQILDKIGSTIKEITKKLANYDLYGKEVDILTRKMHFSLQAISDLDQKQALCNCDRNYRTETGKESEQFQKLDYPA